MYSSYMPILSSAVWDNQGKVYDVGKILTKDFLFDEAAYNDYSRVYLPITYVLSYALQFAALTALLSHTGLWHGRDTSLWSMAQMGTPVPHLLPCTESDQTRPLNPKWRTYSQLRTCTTG
jgi:hypothetical protein